MGTDHELWECAYPHAEAMAAMQAKKLVGKAGLTRSDLPDIRQVMLMAAWRALPKFDPRRAPLEAFITSVIVNAGHMILRSRRQMKRGGGQSLVSLDAEPGIADKARKILDGPADGGRDARISEARQAMAILPPDLAAVAVMLASQSVARTAQLTGRTRREVTADRDRIREHFRRQGLAEEI